MKVAIIVLADTKTEENLARVVNAMMAVKEFQEADDEVKLIFDGSGTRWIKELSNDEHQYHALFEKIKHNVTGACGYCAKAFKVNDDINAHHFHLIDEYEGHPSFRRLLKEGFEVLIF